MQNPGWTLPSQKLPRKTRRHILVGRLAELSLASWLTCLVGVVNCSSKAATELVGVEFDDEHNAIEIYEPPEPSPSPVPSPTPFLAPSPAPIPSPQIAEEVEMGSGADVDMLAQEMVDLTVGDYPSADNRNLLLPKKALFKNSSSSN